LLRGCRREAFQINGGVPGASGGPYSGLPVPGGGLSTRAGGDRTRGNGFQLKEGRVRGDTQKLLFTVRVVRRWNRLPRAAVAAPALAAFKAGLDGALRSLVW